MIYSTIPTQVGAAKLRNASLLGQTVNITRVAFGDGNGAEYEPTGQETELKNQVYECPPNRIEEEPTAPTWIELEAVIPSNVGGWYLREVGCYDDDGDLIFIGNLPSSFKPSGEAGVIKDLVFEMVYDAVAAEVVTIKIDPNVVIATRKYVDDKDQEHVDDADPHPQYLQKIGASIDSPVTLKSDKQSSPFLDLRNIHATALWSYINLACADVAQGDNAVHLAYAKTSQAGAPANSFHVRLKGNATQMSWSSDQVNSHVPLYDMGLRVANLTQMALLPVYPDILTESKKFAMSLVDTTLTVDDEQIIRMRGWQDMSTSDLNRVHQIDLATTYHLRFNVTDGLYLKDVTDAEYNPTAAAETDKLFDTTYDDALLAKIENGVVTPLINTADVFSLTYDGMPNSADAYMSGNDYLGSFELLLDWSRTPVSDSVEIKGHLCNSAGTVWNDLMVETVYATREDVLLIPANFPFDKTYKLNRYECRMPVAHAVGALSTTQPVPFIQMFEKIVRVYGY